MELWGIRSTPSDTYPALAGPSGILAGWGIEINGRFEAEMPPASAWRTATMTPFVTYMQVQKYTTKICELYIRNPEIHEIRSGTKLFITFLSLRFFDMRRERRNFFNKRAAHFVDPNWSRLGETKNQLASARLESQLTAFFFKSSKSSALLGMMSFTSPVLFPIGGFYSDISDCYICPARACTPALNVCTYLTHARSERFSA